jgi:hypothetical protein
VGIYDSHTYQLKDQLEVELLKSVEREPN